MNGMLSRFSLSSPAPK